MSEWWSYRLSDFLMFAPHTYYRLHELHNLSLWPAQLAALLAAPVLVHAVWRAQLRRAFVLLAVGAAAVAGGFMLQQLATIHWAGPGWAMAFAAQAVCLAALAVATPREPPRVAGGVLQGAALLLGFACVAALIEPMALGRDWRQAAVLGLAPDPTALAMLAALAVGWPAGRAARWLHALAWAVPLAWCLFSAATLWTMGSPGAVARGLLPACALALMLHRRRCVRRARSG